MNNKDFHIILELVEKKFNRGDSKNWKNRDFEDLNFEIKKITKINISSHTLKRVFGKIKTDDYYLPQKATIVALKQYVEFEKKHKESIHVEILGSKDADLEKELIEVVDVEELIENKKKPLKILAAVFVLIVIGTALTLLINSHVDETAEGSVKLISQEGRIPTSAQFEYSTPNNKDSFSICYDGNFDPIPVPSGKKMKSNYYYQHPGMYNVRMWKGKKIVSPTIKVYVQTKGWEAFAFYNHQGQLDRYFALNLEQCIKNNEFAPTKKIIKDVGIDTCELAEVTLNNYHPTNFSGDNFILETTLKNSDKWPKSNCNSVYLNISGKKESIQLQFANPGCSYWIYCRISEKKVNKLNENLKNFTFDMTKWQHFHIENKNKTIRVFVNNTLRYTTSYTESIGDIMGVTIRFQGNGYMKSYRLTDLKGTDIFKL